MPRAAGLAAELQDAFGVDAVLHKGDAGIYDVVVDGELLFSKHEVGRFPEEGEIVERLKAKQA